MVLNMPTRLQPFSIVLKLRWNVIPINIRFILTDGSGFKQIHDMVDPIVADMVEIDNAGRHSAFTANDTAMLHTGARNVAVSVGDLTPQTTVARIEETYSVTTVARMAITNEPAFQSDLASLERVGLNDACVTLYPHPVQDLQMIGDGIQGEGRNTDVTERNATNLVLAHPALSHPPQPRVMSKSVPSPRLWCTPSSHTPRPTTTQ